LRALIRWQGLANTFPTQYGVSLYRVRYWTTGADASLTVASGLVAFPRGSRLRGVVSFQHGTASERVSAPSAPDPSNGVLAAAAFAGRGYLLVAPDYVGLGVSAVPHPYLHADSEADAVVDLLRAARDVVAAAGADWPDALLLTGFSQGGHATLAAQRLLEAAQAQASLAKDAVEPFALACQALLEDPNSVRAADAVIAAIGGGLDAGRTGDGVADQAPAAALARPGARHHCRDRRCAADRAGLRIRERLP